jgi:hypothetical protein
MILHFHPELYFIYISIIELEKKKEKVTENSGGERKLLFAHVLAIKKMILDINKFHFIIGFLLKYYLLLIFKKNVHMAWEIFFES